MSIEDIEQVVGGGVAPPSALVDVLDAVDPAGLAGAEVVDFARECFRARNRVTARFLTALHEAGRAEDGQRARRAMLDEFSGDEAAAALGWSRAMAGRWLDLADDLLRRLPEVHAGMRGGDLDDTKARVFSDWTRDLCDDHAHHVCAVVLPEAPTLPVGALIERIQQVAVALDPDWAARREQAARKRARVVASRNPSGTANLAGYDLPVERTAVGMSRVEALAAALRRRGVPMKVEALRAHVYLCLLDGSAAGLDDDTLLDLLTAELRTDPDDDPGGDGSNGPDPDGPDPDGPDAGGPTADDGPSGDDGSTGDDGLTGDDADEPHADESHAADTPADDEPGEEPSGRSGESGQSGESGESGGARSGGVRTGMVEVRLRLSTALGLDEMPAQLPGWGTVLAGHARALLERFRHGEWRVVLTDDTGRLQHVLLARRRPRPAHPRPPGPRRATHQRRGRHGPAIVELQVPTTLLAALDPDDHPAWSALLTELGTRLPEIAARPGAPDHDVAPEHARHRRPCAEVDRWVRTRDRRCVAPSCRWPAHASDLDHTLDHALGGPTLSWDLGCWCRHHHGAKHHGGWRVEQPEPGRFLITTRAGACYETHPARIIDPLPAPRPAPTPRPLPHHEQDPDRGGDDHEDDHEDDDHGAAPDAAHGRRQADHPDDPPRSDLTPRRRIGTTRAPLDDSRTHHRVPGRAPDQHARAPGLRALLRRAHRIATTNRDPNGHPRTAAPPDRAPDFDPPPF